MIRSMDRLPFADWERYKVTAFLGEGGMGEVYLALDPVLNRQVALKFLRREDPEQLRRFFNEAQAQARIDHENVCRVYEVGEIEGHPYICMQYIDGRPVNRLGPEVSLEQKVRIMQQVAEGIHAAHRLGLIHRDVKPANILVERREDGSLHPYVMDFGLVRQQGSQDLTASGALMGSPAYMSPEQAEGKTRQLDRRTDVYSLGTALYEIIMGRPPFEGENQIHVLMRVLQDEPDPPRALDPTIPADLETIVMKCLEKDPIRRYDSARALSEDLGFFLDGEPIRARPGGITYRLAKKIRKNKTLSAVVLVAVILVGILAGFGIHTRIKAREQALIAQRFGQDVKDMENIMFRAHLMPIHDINREKTMVREKINRIRAELPSLGDIGRGPGNYALGTGYRALNDFQQARVCFDRAWAADYRLPEVARGLGMVMWELYQQGMDEAGKITNQELRLARQQELHRLYLEPAVKYLTASRGAAGEPADYVDALLAFFRKDYDQALDHVGRAIAATPWHYPARQLEGLVYMELGQQKMERGEYAAAAASFDRAEAALKEALEIARSDGTLALDMGRLGVYRMSLDNLRSGSRGQEYLREAVSSCDRAGRVDPEDVNPILLKARLYCLWGERLAARGKDPLAAYGTSLEESNRAMELDPSVPGIFDILGRALYRRAEYGLHRGVDPRHDLDAAIVSLQRGVRLDPNNIYTHANLAIANILYGFYEKEKGRDPMVYFRRAMSAYSVAIELNPRVMMPLINRGTDYLIMADYESKRGGDTRPLLEKAIADFRRVIEINPNEARIYSKLGDAYEQIGEYEMGQGRDPRPSFTHAFEFLDRAAELNPKLISTFMNMGITLSQQAEYEMSRGIDPRPSLDRAVKEYQRCLDLIPDDADVYNNLGNIYQIRARYELDHGLDPREALDRGEEQFRSGLRLTRGDHVLLAGLSCTLALRGDYEVLSGLASDGTLREALAHLDESVKINSEYYFSWLYRAYALRVRARAAGRSPQAADRDVALSREAIRKALALNSQSLDVYLESIRLELFAARRRVNRGEPAAQPLIDAGKQLDAAEALNAHSPRLAGLRAEWYYLRATAGRQPGQPIDRRETDAGLRAADTALRDNARLGQAHLMKALLWRLVSESAREGRERDEARRQAQSNLNRALSDNGRLKPEYDQLVRLLM